jgi:hypothetical protein
MCRVGIVMIGYLSPLQAQAKPSAGDASDDLQLATKSSMLILYHIMLFYTTTRKMK